MKHIMPSSSPDKQTGMIQAFNYFDSPYSEHKLFRAYSSETKAPFLDLHSSISNGFVLCKIIDKRDGFDFGMVQFPFMDGDVPRSTTYGVYISQHFSDVACCYLWLFTLYINVKIGKNSY